MSMSRINSMKNPDAVTNFVTSFGGLHRVAKGSNGGTFIRFPRKSVVKGSEGFAVLHTGGVEVASSNLAKADLEKVTGAGCPQQSTDRGEGSGRAHAVKESVSERNTKVLSPWPRSVTLWPLHHANFAVHYHRALLFKPKPQGRQPVAHMAWAQCRWHRYRLPTAHQMECHREH